MKFTRIIALVLASQMVMALAITPSFAKQKPRTVELNYSAPTCGRPSDSCPFDVDVLKNERFLSASITDATGTSVWAYILQYDDTAVYTATWFCGRTDAPVKIKRGVTVHVYVFLASDHGGCSGVATQGVVGLTFSSTA